MQLEQLKATAEYQMVYWKVQKGHIEKLDVTEKTIELGGKQFHLDDIAMDSAIKRLGLNGTHSDFYEDDKEFFQRAVNRKIDFAQKSPSIAIFDSNNDEAIAIRSSRYQRVLNKDVIDKATELFGESFDDRMSYISRGDLHIAASNMKQGILMKNGRAKIIEKGSTERGEIIGIGADMGNSDGGEIPLIITQNALRLSCFNGSITKLVLTMSRFIHSRTGILDDLMSGVKTILSNENIFHTLNTAYNRPAFARSVEDIPGKLKMLTIPVEHHQGIVAAHVTEPIGVSDEGINGYGLWCAATRYTTHVYPSMPNFSYKARTELLEKAFPLLTV